MEDVFAELRQLSADQRELALRLLQKEGVDIARLPVPARTRADRAPLSTAQQRLLAMHELAAGLPTENVPVAIELDGELDLAALAAAINTLIKRHAILRTTIDTDEQPALQRIHEHRDIDLPLIEVAASEQTDDGIDAALAAQARLLFDLANDWLMRPVIFRVASKRHILLLTFHQLVADGWAVNILTRELGAAYTALTAGSSPELGELAVQFADYAEWEQEGWEAPAVTAQLDYWVAQLTGSPAVLDIPTGRQRPATPAFSGALSRVEFNAATISGLRDVARTEGVTMFTAVLASLKILFAAYSGQDDIVVGTLTSRRGRPEAETMVGNFGNNLLLRSTISPRASLREILRSVNETVLDAMAHQDAALEDINAALYQRTGQRIPAFQTGFIYREAALEERLQLPGINVRQRFVDTGTARLDLWLDLVDSGTSLSGEVLYRDDLFEQQQIDLFAGHWEDAIRQLGEFPDLPVGEIDIFGSDAGLSRARSQDVAAMLESHASVAAVRVDAPGPLVGGPVRITFVRAGSMEITGTELRDWLTAQLPFALGPAMFIEADALTDTLAAPARDRTAALPESELEKSIAALWAEVLGIDTIYADDNFFDLGGHSLLAVQVLKQLRELGAAPPDPKSLVTGTLRQLAVQMSAQGRKEIAAADHKDPAISPQQGLLGKLVNRRN